MLKIVIALLPSNTLMLTYYNKARLAQNNLNLLRFVFAVMVFLVHSYELSGQRSLAWLTYICSSKIAVESFFILSGFLIFMSYEKSSSLKAYYSKRVRRIYPAYFLVIMLSAVGLWKISGLSINNYFSYEWVKYLIANLTFLNFLHPTLPGVFTSNPTSAVNH